MTLNDFLATRGRATELAGTLGVSLPYISQLASGHRRPSIAQCVAIERATGGVVRCEDLRPDLAEKFSYLAGRRGAVAVATVRS